MPTSGSSPSQKTRVSVKRWCSACIYYWNPYSNRQTWKNLIFFTGINVISSQASMETLSVIRQCCLVHFWWKIFSSFFQLIFWTIFSHDFVENFMFFQAKLTIMYDYIRQNLWKVLDFLMKSCKKYSSKYELEKWWKYFSSEMHQTTLPGHWKCFHFMPVTRSHWSLWKKSSFFMFVDYYRDSNSKCMHYIIALQKRVSFVRARSRK